MNLPRKLNDIRKALTAYVVGGNTVERAVRSTKARDFRKDLREAMVKQTMALLRTDFLEEITGKMGKGVFTNDEEDDEDNVQILITDQDKDHIKKALEKYFLPLSLFLGTIKFFDLLRWATNVGGQSFLDEAGSDQVFNITNPNYLDALSQKTDFLISGVDDTTKNWIKNQIITGKLNGASNDDVANSIRALIPDTYANRAETIVNTEISGAANEALIITARNNGAAEKRWIIQSGNPCEICLGNEDDGWILIDDVFSSGDFQPDAHPNCQCTIETTGYNPDNISWTGE